MNSTIDSVVCAACGCLCENVTVRIEHGVISEVDGACKLCAERLIGQTAGEANSPRIQSASDILAQSRAPLVYGMNDSTVEAQRAAIALAERLGAIIDLAIPDFHRASLQATQSVGLSTCTLGEVRQRADVVVFWGSDPSVTHPALLERISSPRVAGRYVVSIDSKTPGYSVDEFLQVDAEGTMAALAALRANVAGVALDAVHQQHEQLQRLATRLLGAEYSVVFFGPGVGGVVELESLFRLVRQLNEQSRCVAIGLGGTQCENVLTWQTGYPHAVNFAAGYPQYDPIGYTANTVLERGQVDAAVVINGHGLLELSDRALVHLERIPVILLDWPDSHWSIKAKVKINIALPGVHCAGTVFRMDAVPICMRAIFLDSPLPTAECILTAIHQGIHASCV